uniref:Uncharacterized protein n=1 Tax=Erpetoichthys calabaricus TaxID=27687 RepID=A0A8C4S962_ERPCA
DTVKVCIAPFHSARQNSPLSHLESHNQRWPLRVATRVIAPGPAPEGGPAIGDSFVTVSSSYKYARPLQDFQIRYRLKYGKWWISSNSCDHCESGKKLFKVETYQKLSTINNVAKRTVQFSYFVNQKGSCLNIGLRASYQRFCSAKSQKSPCVTVKAAVCHWETFHTCATAALSECQEEAGKIWETLKEESKKIRFQGSLFDLCSPNTAPRLMGLIRSGNFLVLFSATLVWLAL